MHVFLVSTATYLLSWIWGLRTAFMGANVIVLLVSPLTSTPPSCARGNKRNVAGTLCPQSQDLWHFQHPFSEGLFDGVFHQHQGFLHLCQWWGPIIRIIGYSEASHHWKRTSSKEKNNEVCSGLRFSASITWFHYHTGYRMRGSRCRCNPSEKLVQMQLFSLMDSLVKHHIAWKQRSFLTVTFS